MNTKTSEAKVQKVQTSLGARYEKVLPPLVDFAIRGTTKSPEFCDSGKKETKKDRKYELEKDVDSRKCPAIVPRLRSPVFGPNA